MSERRFPTTEEIDEMTLEEIEQMAERDLESHEARMYFHQQTEGEIDMAGPDEEESEYGSGR